MTHRTGIKMHDWLLTDDRDISRSDWVTKFIPLFQEVIFWAFIVKFDVSPFFLLIWK